MRRSLSILPIMVAMSFFTLTAPAPAQEEAARLLKVQATGYSYHVLFTGTFFEPGKAPDGTPSLYTFEVIVDGKKKWIFVIDKAVSLSRTATQLGILKGIFPPVLSFRGQKKALDYLQDPGIAGKRLLINGLLYKKERRLQVIRVEPATEEEISVGKQPSLNLIDLKRYSRYWPTLLRAQSFLSVLE